MRKMTLAERKAYVSEMAKNDPKSNKIGEENTKREAFLEKEVGEDTFGDATSEAVAVNEQFGFKSNRSSLHRN